MAFTKRAAIVLAITGQLAGVAMLADPTPAIAQDKVLSGDWIDTVRDRLAKAEQDLDGKIQRCEKIDPYAYRELSDELERMRKASLAAKKAGAPIASGTTFNQLRALQDQINAFLRRAASAAEKQKACKPPTQTAQVPGQTGEVDTHVEPPKLTSTATFGPNQPGSNKPPAGSLDYTEQVKAAEQQFEAARRRCDIAGMQAARAVLAALEAALKAANAEGAKKFDAVFEHVRTAQPMNCPETAKQSTALPAAQLDPTSAMILAMHNSARAEVGSPPLQWDSALAAGAASWAEEMARIGQLVHAPREGRANERENLLSGQRGVRTPQQMVQVWLSEKRYFRAGIFPDVSTTGRWEDIAHYSQIISAFTERVGCALKSVSTGDYFVCRYSPPGNIDGKPILASAGGSSGPQSGQAAESPSAPRKADLKIAGSEDFISYAKAFRTRLASATADLRTKLKGTGLIDPQPYERLLKEFSELSDLYDGARKAGLQVDDPRTGGDIVEQKDVLAGELAYAKSIGRCRPGPNDPPPMKDPAANIDKPALPKSEVHPPPPPADPKKPLEVM